MTGIPNSLEARDVSAVLHAYTNAAAHLADGPFVVAGGDGIHILDSEGNRYIEGLGGLFCASLGSGLIDQSQKMTAAAMQMAEEKV